MAKLSEVIVEPTWCHATSEELRQRQEIESRHGDDDGTMRIARRLEAGRAIYRNNTSPPDDDDHFSELEPYGLSLRAIQRFEQAGLKTISDIQKHIHQITEWRQCGIGMQQETRIAMENLRKARADHIAKQSAKQTKIT